MPVLFNDRDSLESVGPDSKAIMLVFPALLVVILGPAGLQLLKALASGE